MDASKEEAAYRRVLAISPDNMVATNNLSLLLTKVGRPAEAESLIAPLVRASPDPGNMMLQLLAAQVGQRHDDDVRRTLATMAETRPDLPLYIWGRGIALHTMQDYDGADRAYRDLELKTRDPGFQSMATFGLARMALTRGRLADAEREAPGWHRGQRAARARRGARCSVPRTSRSRPSSSEATRRARSGSWTRPCNVIRSTRCRSSTGRAPTSRWCTPWPASPPGPSSS